MRADTHNFGYQYDVKMIGIICWHILISKRISNDSLKNISEEMNKSNHWIAPLLLEAVEGDSCQNANELFENLQRRSPSNEHIFDFEDSQLDNYLKDFNHARKFKESQVILETSEREIYM